MSVGLPPRAGPSSTRLAGRPARAVSTVLVAAIALACSTAAVAQQDPRVREILEAQQRGLEEGGDKMRDGARKLENAGSGGMEELAEGMVDVAEGFCTVMNSNADAFAELGIDFSGMVEAAAGGESAAKYSQAKDVCGQMQAPTESFALSGCTDIVVGSRTTLSIAAARGGSYRFSDNKPGVLGIATHGSSATVTAIAPGIVTVKAERTDKAKGASASEVVYSLEVKSINAGNPVRMGLYDAKGRSIGHHDVSVEVVPRGAARRVIYRPASGLLTAVGDADRTLTLRASAPGRTTVQAMTSCGQATGPALEVEIVPCTDEVRAELRAERDRLHKRRDRILAAISDVLNDPEVERAMREFEGHAKDLAKKAGELVVTAAGGRALGAGKLAQTGQQVMKTLADVDSVAEHAVNLIEAGKKGEVGGQRWNETALKAYGDAVANTVDLIAGKALVGPLKTAIEAGMAAQDVGQDIGTSLGAADRLKELDTQLDAVIKELEDVWRRLELCKDKRTPPEEPSRPDGPSEAEPPTESTSRSELPPEQGRPPQQAKEIEVGDNDAPVRVEQPDDKDTPPEPPGSPASAATMAGLMFEEQCPGWEPVAARQTEVFTTLGNNVGVLGQFFDTQKTQLLDPLAKHLEGSQQALQLFAETQDLPTEQKLARLKQVNALLSQYRPEKLAGFGPGLEVLSVQSQGCSGLLRNSFELKIEEMRLKY